MPDGKKAVGAHARGQVVIILHTQNFFENSSLVSNALLCVNNDI
jgi:hypothetical protein